MSLETIKERVEVARQHIDDLCTGKARWTMRVPVDMERDSDTIFAAALADTEALLRVAEAADWLLGEQDCPATSGGTEGKWCLNHDTPMVDDRCEMVATLARALDELDALP